MLTLSPTIRALREVAPDGRRLYVPQGQQIIRADRQWVPRSGLLGRQPPYPSNQVDHGSAAQTPPWTDRLGAVPPNRLAEREGQRKVFTQYSDDLGELNTTWIPIIDNQPAETDAFAFIRGEENVNCWWIITLCGKEVIRNSDVALAQLPRNVIAAQGFPSSRIRARIEWIHAGDGCFMDVDIGPGTRIGIEGCDVVVKLLGPRGLFRVPGKEDDSTMIGPNGGTFLDSLITGRIVPCWSPPPTGCNCATLTQTLRVGANVDNLTSPVPPFARTLTVSRPGGYPAAGTFLIVNPGAGGVLRSMFETPSDPENSHLVEVPGTAALWDSGAGEGAQRLFTLTWGLRI